MYLRHRNIVPRADGRKVNVARFRGQLFVCSLGCCCGRTDDGFAPVPAEKFHDEWERRKLRNVVHLTVGGCLGPCGLANVVLLVFDGMPMWFHSINSEDLVIEIYGYVEDLLESGHAVTPSARLAKQMFSGFTWQPRPDGQPVDDLRRLRVRVDGTDSTATERSIILRKPAQSAGVERAVAIMDGVSSLPRKNGELVFEEPWHGRAFGMAVAMNEHGLFEWEEFRERLVVRIREMATPGTKFAYYEAWLSALEDVLGSRKLVTTGHLDEVTSQFEFGERDDVY